MPEKNGVLHIVNHMVRPRNTRGNILKLAYIQLGLMEGGEDQRGS